MYCKATVERLSIISIDVSVINLQTSAIFNTHGAATQTQHTPIHTGIYCHCFAGTTNIKWSKRGTLEYYAKRASFC